MTGVHVHWHGYVGSKGANSYYECRCGSRRVQSGRGYTPIDRSWLKGRPEWDAPKPSLPPKRVA